MIIKVHAPGTWKVICPGTQECHVPLVLQKCFHICSPCEQSSYCRSVWHLRWCLKLPLHLGAHSFLGWVVFSPPLLEVGLLLSSSLGTQLITLPWTTMTPDGSWAESSLLIHTVVTMHRVCDGNMHTVTCWAVSHLGNSIHLPTFSQHKKSFLYDFASQLSGSWPMPADGVAG